LPFSVHLQCFFDRRSQKVVRDRDLHVPVCARRQGALKEGRFLHLDYFSESADAGRSVSCQSELLTSLFLQDFGDVHSASCEVSHGIRLPVAAPCMVLTLYLATSSACMIFATPVLPFAGSASSLRIVPDWHGLDDILLLYCKAV
jgi:hypothetical protein